LFVFTFALLVAVAPIRAAVTGFTNIDIQQALYTQYSNFTYEASSSNDFVLHFTVQGADTLQSIAIDNIGGGDPAQQLRDLSAVRLLLDADGNTSNGFTTIGTFNVDSTHLHWTLNLSTPVSVSDGDNLYVAVDATGPVTSGPNRTINMKISAGTVTFTNTSAVIPSADLQNQYDFVLNTSKIQPAFYNVSLNDSMPSTIAIGQTGVPIFHLDFSSKTSFDADVNLKSVRLLFYDGNTLINPVTVVSAVTVTSTSPYDLAEYFDNTTTGLPISSCVGADHSLTIPLNLIDTKGPQSGVAYPNSLLFTADFLSSTFLTNLRVVAQASTDVIGRDSNTEQFVPAAGSFPLQSSSAAFQYPASMVSAVLNASGAATQVSKGSTANSAFQVVLNNPGASNTGIAQLSKLDFTVTDGSGNPIAPNSALKWIHIDDGRFTYLSRSVTESTGNTVTCNGLLLNVNLSISNPVTLFVKYDVVAGNGSPSTLQFHVPSFSGWKVIQAGNDSSSVSVSGSPFSSASVPIVALFHVSHASRMPSLVVKGQKNVPFLDLSLNHPGPALVGPIAVRSLTFHLLDRNGAAVETSNAFQNPRFQIGDTTPDQTASFSGNKVTVTFSSGITLDSSSPSNAVILSFLADVSSACPSDSLELRLESPNDFVAVQPSDLSRIVFAQAYGDTYPMTTGIVSLQSIDLKGSFTNFPNPFKPETGATKFTYWLTQNGTVNLRLFSMTGIPVRKLVTGESRNAGLNITDTWDGRNDSGRMVLNGVYLAVLEVDSSGSKSTVKRFVAVVK
jgi:hypothetical protein